MAAEEPLESLCVHLERRALANVWFDRAKDIRCDVLGLIPMFLVPVAQRVDLSAGELDVQLDVLDEPRMREVR